MSVGTYVIPDHLPPVSQEGTAFKLNIKNCLMVTLRLAGAFAPHEQDTPDMTVRLDAGALPYLVSGAAVEHAGQDTATITAPATNPRIDLVVIDAETAAVSVVAGAEAAAPDPPALPDGKLPVCEVALTTATTEITNAEITDKRIGGGAAAEAIPIGGIYENLGPDPATELGYGTWSLIPVSPYPKAADLIYPPGLTSDWANANTYGAGYQAYKATDITKSLTGALIDNGWADVNLAITNRRFHINLGHPYPIRGVYYENCHDSGGLTDAGVNNFTVQGSNDIDSFNDLDYTHNTGWTAITTGVTAFVQHVAADQVDPKYIDVTAGGLYQYVGFKFADNYGYANIMGLRRLVVIVGPHQWLRTA